MFLKDFLYFLTDKAGKSYRVTGNTVSTTGTPTPLPTTPDGWQEKSVRWGRSTKYHGMIRTFTTPLKFVKEGARIIRELFYTIGFESELFLVISRLDKTFGAGWVHKLFFYGELDLSKTQDEQDTVTVNVMEGGLDKLIKANEGTTYEIELNEIIRHDGVLLDGYFKFSEINDTINYVNAPIIYVPLVSFNDARFGIMPSTQLGIELAAGWEKMATNISNQVLSVNVSGNISFSSPRTGNFMLYINVRDSSDNYVSTVFNTGIVSTNSMDQAINITVPLNPGDYLQCILDIPVLYSPGGTDNMDITWTSDYLEIVYQYLHPESQVNSISAYALGQKLIEKIAGAPYDFSSNLLSNDWAGLKITSGDAIRRLTGSVIKTSWNDFFQSINSVLNVELSISGNTVSIEKKESAYQGTVSADLGNVADLSISVAQDYLVNGVKIGYPDIDLEDINGRDEFNVTHIYSSAIKRTSKYIDLVSIYRASMYEMEFIRMNLDGKDTTNSATDNLNYFILCDNTPVLHSSGLYYYWNLRRDTYDEISGIFDPATAFNIEISPKRNLLRHGNYLRSLFYFQQNTSLTFQTSDKNADLETVRYATMISAEERIKESGNVLVSTLDSPLFIPLQATFNSPAPIDLWDIMETAPLGTFTFTWNGDTYKGFVLEISVQPADNAPQETRLLLSSDNNLSTLIR